VDFEGSQSSSWRDLHVGGLSCAGHVFGVLYSDYVLIWHGSA
jgi:hypothetical protein